MKVAWTQTGLLVFLVALVLRAGWVGLQWQQHGAKLDYPDEQLHWQLATNLVQRGTMVTDDGRYAARMPAYPLFLAPFAATGPSGILGARLLQALLGALTAGIAWRTAHAAGGARAAFVAGLLVACDPYSVFSANLLLTEVLFTLALVALVASAHWLTRAPARRWTAAWVHAGAGMLALQTRQSVVLLLPALWLLIILLAPQRARVARYVLLSPILLFATLVPWALRNQAVIGGHAWLSTNGGVTLYDAVGPQADGSSNQDFLKGMPELAGMGEIAADRRLQQLALAELWRHPGRVLRLAGVKFVRFWNPLPNFAELRQHRTAWIGAAYTLLVGLAATAALLCAARPRRSDQTVRAADTDSARRFQAFMWLPILYFTLLHMLYIGSVRYRVPLMPLLSLAAATLARAARSGSNASGAAAGMDQNSKCSR